MPHNGLSVALLLRSGVVFVVKSEVVEFVSPAFAVFVVTISPPMTAAKAVISSSVSAVIFLSIFLPPPCCLKTHVPERLLNDFSEYPQVFTDYYPNYYRFPMATSVEN